MQLLFKLSQLIFLLDGADSDINGMKRLRTSSSDPSLVVVNFAVGLERLAQSLPIL